MANRDDYRGFRGEPGREPRRQEGRGTPAEGRDEPRSFGERGRFNSDEARYAAGPRGGPGDGEREPWRRERYGSRFDQDRVDYGSGYDREGGEYGRGQSEEARRLASAYGGGYGGQEYGMEGHGDGLHSGGQRRREPYADEHYGAPQPYAHPPPIEQEFDTDYLHWREEQLRLHDRDYQDWRRHQQQQHDEEYRRFRAERRDTFGRNFLDWRAQRNAVQATPETQDYAGRSAIAAGGPQPSDTAASTQTSGPGGSESSSEAGKGRH